MNLNFIHYFLGKFSARRSQSLRTPRDIPRVPFYRQPNNKNSNKGGSNKRVGCTTISIEDNSLLTAHQESPIIDVPTPGSDHGSPIGKSIVAQHILLKTQYPTY